MAKMPDMVVGVRIVGETEHLLRLFDYKHLPEKLQQVAKPCCVLARGMAGALDGFELTAGLRKLLEAKDCFVRAALAEKEPNP